MHPRYPDGLDGFHHLFIDGQRQKGKGASRSLVDPATNQTFAQVADATPDEVDQAVVSASVALKGPWGSYVPGQRAACLFAFAAAIAEASEELAILESLNVGKPYGQALRDVGRSAAYFRFYAGVCEKLNGDSIPLGAEQLAFTLREPLGVSAQILPWNYPISTLARGVAPALAAGCTVVAKPAEATPLSALLLADLAQQAGLPAGVFNVVTGDGAAGAALAAHRDVAQVTFTGSTGTGRRVMQAAASPLAGVTLELGGKSPVVALEGADPDQVAAGIIRGLFFNAGQICTAGSRLLVTAELHDAVMARIVDHVGKMQLGHGLDDPDMGPLISHQHRLRVDGFVQRAKKAGLECLIGGTPIVPHDWPEGAFYAPTVFARVPVMAEIAQAEIFGPVLTTHIVADLEEAVCLANATPFGLVAGVYTPDITVALQFARQVEAGQVFINGYLQGGDTVPFGGVKQSGIGREKALPHWPATPLINPLSLVTRALILKYHFIDPRSTPVE